MAADEYPAPGFEAELPDWLDSERPAQQPARPDLPWVTGLVEYRRSTTGETRVVDLGRVTETWLRERLGTDADTTLAALDRVRPYISEVYFGFILAGAASHLIYDE